MDAKLKTEFENVLSLCTSLGCFAMVPDELTNLKSDRKLTVKNLKIEKNLI